MRIFLQSLLENELIEDVKPYNHPFYIFKEDSDKLLLLIHGAVGSPADFGFLKMRSELLPFNIYSTLLPGHGRSYKDLQKIEWTDCYNHVEELLNKVVSSGKFDEIFMLGHSFGGVLTLKIASSYDLNGIITGGAPIISALETKRSKDAWKHTVGDAVRHTRGRVKNIECPILIFHASNDAIISPKNAFEIHNTVLSEEKYLFVDNYSGHFIFSLSSYERVFKNIINFVSMDRKLYDVAFRIEVKGERSMHLLGTFSNWGKNGLIKLERNGDYWEVVLKLKRGIHEYYFLRDKVTRVIDPLKSRVRTSWSEHSIIHVPDDG